MSPLSNSYLPPHQPHNVNRSGSRALGAARRRYCPGCGDWPKSGECCSNTGSVRSYFSRLDYAKSQGFLNRTVFCFGFILGRSAINPTGWTAESLEAAMMEVKTAYPELGGVLM